MNNQEDPMRTTVKPVHQWINMEGEDLQRRKIEKWLFGAMFLWPVVLGVSVDIAFPMHSEFANYLTYLGSPIFAASLIGIALHYYPASRRFLQWFAGIILVVALYIGVGYYYDSLQHGWKWVESAIRSPVVWFDGLLVFLSAIYLIVPQRAWRWLGDRMKLLWKRVRHGRSI